MLNTPNLSSAAGSWIIHFAELKETDNKAKPTAPVALNAVDPAYTPDAMRDRVEGTVTLYAVIRADGSVTDIKVLNSLDDRLDSSAMRALSRWHFRPGTKNGEAIALEAVVDDSVPDEPAEEVARSRPLAALSQLVAFIFSTTAVGR